MKTYVIIGAGILGASTAYHLAKEGVKVVLIDKAHEGQATEAAAGIVCPWVSQRRNKVWYNLAKGGAAYYPPLVRELELLLNEDVGYQKVGALSLHTDQKKLSQMEERSRKRKEEAPEMEDIALLDEVQTKNRFPFIGENYSSVYVSGAGRVDGRKIRDALIRSALHHGAKHIRSEASLRRNQKGQVSVLVHDEVVEADGVVVAAGIWAKELLEQVGIEFHVTAQKAEILHLRTREHTDHLPVVMPPSSHYFVPFEAGKMVVGTTHDDEGGQERDTRPTAGGIFEILDKSLQYAPMLKNSELTGVRVGFRPYTPGFLPVFGGVPGVENLFVGNGLGASGLTAGPFLGKELAYHVLGYETVLNPSDYPVEGAIE
ncbi:oxidoreductase [Bacillus coahuilensis m2-6]|uniref:NAD(P)/FAD-dependent oxidoreductase n=1 Tax=Bacillus coahuilensis TaxID=408580 RepID=UPI0001851002|nr:FAD-binding oxidoreductase [Bacillus coahuilensis]KUP09828.1 oxidoreductase [Bacillus coahuilensis m2-6]